MMACGGEGDISIQVVKKEWYKDCMWGGGYFYTSGKKGMIQGLYGGRGENFYTSGKKRNDTRIVWG